MTFNVKNEQFAQDSNGLGNPNETSNSVNNNTKHFFEDNKTLKKIKTIAGPVGLLVGLMLYTAVGGLVSFYFLSCQLFRAFYHLVVLWDHR